MPYTFSEIKKFVGLFAQANSFELPDGAMEKATNVVINGDNTIAKIRGFYTYFTPLTDVLNALFNYQNKLIAIYRTKVAWYANGGTAPNETGVETVNGGLAVSIGATRTSRAAEQSGNFYFTTDDGIDKLDAYNNPVFKAGAPPGLDLRGNFLPANGVLQGDSEVAYRVLFGRRDANNNEILGAPSDILTLTNAKVVGATYTSSGGGPYTVTVTAIGHNLANGMAIVVSDATNMNADGTATVTVTGVNSFTFSTVANPASGTLNYGVTRMPLLEFSVPSEITAVGEAWFYQIYRTSQTADATISPLADFRLIDEQLLTAGQISAGVVTYEDEVEDILVLSAPELYTNPNSREGESQQNLRPPLAQDITLFRNYMFYLNCETRQFLELDVVDPSVLVNGSYVEIKVGSTTRRYVAQDGVGNRTTRSSLVSNVSGLTITSVANGLTNGETVYISTITGGTLTQGTYFVISAAADTFKISLTSGGAAIAYNGETSLYFEGVTNGTNPIFQFDKTSTDIAVQLRNTAQGLVKAVNRDHQSLVYGNYVSGISDTPGMMRFTAIGFTGTIYMRADSTNSGLAWAPALPGSFSVGTQVFSTNSAQPNGVYVSKIGESEAVPIVNFLPVGSRNKAILRGLSLRDSVIILKEDGVWKISGDNPTNFQATAIDNTVIAVARDSARLLNNQVYFLSNQGICVATDSSVEIVSRRIEDLIEPVIGKANVDSDTHAVSYESDRTYRIATIGPNDDVQTTTYFHNAINDTWTDSDILFTGGCVGPANKLYLISTGNDIISERKTQTRIDYAMDFHAVTIVSVGLDNLSAVVTVTSYDPQVGDFIVKDQVINRIDSVTQIAGSDYLMTFIRQCNLVAADSLILYERLVSEVRMAPYSGGMVGQAKQFAQLQIHTRTPSITKLSISFSGQTFGGSEVTDWNVVLVSSQGGWGFEPWGFFPWGQADAIQNPVTTQPAPVLRLYVPIFQQRNTFIQTVLRHEYGGEAMEIQALSWALRVYRERVSK